jgi:hypothetical protein
MKQELERVGKGTKLNALNDPSKYLNVDEPLDKGKIANWKQCIDQANTNFQYAEIR